MVRVVSTACLASDFGLRIANDDGVNLFYDGGSDTLNEYETEEPRYQNLKTSKTPSPIKGGRKATRRPSDLA